MATLLLEIAAPAATGRPFVPMLRRRVLQAHQLLRSPLRELSLVLVGNHTMARLNRQFLHISGPTDVLTFELERNSRGDATSGEIVICVQEAVRQARLRGIDAGYELLLYALHGLLHLNGFNDKSQRGFKAMHRREDQILTALGVGPVFAPSRTRRRTGAK
jgi:probable rRNA maturation factor